MKKLRRIGTSILILAAIGRDSGQALDTADTASPPLTVQSLELSGTNIASLTSLPSEQLGVVVSALVNTPTIPAADLPKSGTFRSLKEPSFPPLPGNVTGDPCWILSDGSYLLEDTTVSLNAMAAAASSSTDVSPMDSSGPPALPGSGDDTNGVFTANGLIGGIPLNTNLLWLQITNVLDGTAYANLYNPTDSYYGIYSTTNLLTPFSLWSIETEVITTQTNCMPFTVASLGRPNLFLRAEDWTGVSSNGLPVWWTWLYFGNLLENATNWDSQGFNTLGYDYEYSLDPNVISFTLLCTNQYVNASDAAVQMSVTAGKPSYFAVLVDDTNDAHAIWMAYNSSNITADLGSTQGWHQVSVGLRGLPANAHESWQTTEFKLDLSPPLLVVTNPTPGTVTRPVIQLQGYSTEALAGISYDLANATGLITNQQTLILGQYYDTNALEWTTSYFQCFDIALTNGLNTITLHATDLAGNVTTTNFNFILNYSTASNPPTVQLDWPLAGTQISGSSFTARGLVSDPTATVRAQIVTASGETNWMIGRVGRGGDFYVDNVPLAGGVSSLSLIATDAAGNTNVTTIPVTQSALALTIDDATLGGAVDGTISDTNYTIWVNGVMATNNLDGTWVAPDPGLTLDTPTVQVRAIPNSDNGGYGNAPAGRSNPAMTPANPSSPGATDAEQQLVWPDASVYVSALHLNETASYSGGSTGQWQEIELLGGFGPEVPGNASLSLNWDETSGGTAQYVANYSETPWNSFSDSYFWAAGGWPELPNGMVTCFPGGSTNEVAPANQEFADYSTAWYGSGSFTSSDGKSTQSFNDSAQVTLITGGKPGSTDTEIYAITGFAEATTFTDQSGPPGVANDLSPGQIQISGLGSMAYGWTYILNEPQAGVIYASLPATQKVNITPVVAAPGYVSVGHGAIGMPITSSCVSPIPPDQSRTTLGVGEQVNLTAPNGFTNTTWSTTGGGLTKTAGATTMFTAPSNAPNGGISVTITARSDTGHGVLPATKTFMVFPPTGHGIAISLGGIHYGIGQIGAGMTNLMIFYPTNVSFYRVFTWELPAGIANVKGYFANNAKYIPAPQVGYATLDQRNSMQDVIVSGLFGFSSYSLPLYQGSWDYVTTNMWAIPGSPTTNYLITLTSTSTLLDSDGDFSVSKCGVTATRTPNDVITIAY